ncbi:uncharacterized protein TNCV_1988451 [Trichonephila clavipes]|nr:uncharacterized protein TNCV_1988451 [Trichonephila clavipes]
MIHKSRQYLADTRANPKQINVYDLQSHKPARPTAAFDSTRGLLVTDHVISNHGQVTWTTPEEAPPLLTTTSHQWEDVSALDRFNVYRCPTWRVYSGTGLELVTRQVSGIESRPFRLEYDALTTRLPTALS